MSRFWYFVIAAFVLLIAAWTTFIILAARHTPEVIPIQ